LGQSLLISEGNDVTIAAVGNKVEVAMKVAEKLKETGLSADVIYCRFIKPLDSNTIINSVLKTKRLVTIEDNTVEVDLEAEFWKQ